MQNKELSGKNTSKKDKIVTIANGITLLRIICTVIMIFYIQQTSYGKACFFFVIAALTDFFDGFVARVRNEESILGSYLDPIADKFLVVSSFFLLHKNIENIIPIWFLALLLMRELLLVFGGILLYFRYGKKALINPTVISKINTVILLFFIFAIFCSQLFAIFIPYQFLLVISTIFIVASSTQYAIVFVKKLQIETC